MSASTTITSPDTGVLSGVWTYRSYRNVATLVDGDKDKALALIFGEGIYTLDQPTQTTLRGTLDMGGGYVLDVQGTVTQAAPRSIAVAGIGREGTPTAGWEYDYNATLAYTWPDGVNQVPALVGSVIRAKPHDGAPAGVVTSFIAVRQR